MFQNMVEVLEPRETDNYKLEYFEVTQKKPDTKFLWAGFRQYGEYRDLKAGNYVRLIAKNGFDRMIMSDTQMERRTNQEFINQAKGDVLVAGLGIGLVLLPLEAKSEVTSITVIELSDEITKMVIPQLLLKKTKVIQADIFEYQPDQKFDTIYFDIWPTISADNYDEMKGLHNRFAEYLREKGWINSWHFQYCLELKFECTGCDGNGYCVCCDGGGDCQDCDEEEECGMCNDGECYECDGEGNCLECNGEGYIVTD